MDGVALITGAASGIGAATVRAFLAAGVTRLVLADKDAGLLEFAASLGARVLPVVCDVGDEEAVVRLHDAAKAEFGRIDYAVNCAGTSMRRRLVEVSGEDWDAVVASNQRGAFLCTREQLKIMEAQHLTGEPGREVRGSIVNISGVSGLVGIPANAANVSSKHALVGLAKAAAAEYASMGIRINNVAPGWIATPLMVAPANAPMLAACVDKTPAGRAGKPEEVADVILFLSGRGASFVNGATWTVDGGYVAV